MNSKKSIIDEIKGLYCVLTFLCIIGILSSVSMLYKLYKLYTLGIVSPTDVFNVILIPTFIDFLLYNFSFKLEYLQTIAKYGRN